MSKKVEQAFQKLLELPEREQEIAAEAILDYASHDRGVELSDEQVAEVERRLAAPNKMRLTLDEFTRRIEKLVR